MSFACDKSMIQRFIENLELDANVCCKIQCMQQFLYAVVLKTLSQKGVI